MASPSSVHQVRVRYGETDQMGVVHHASFILYLEEARTHFMEERGESYAELERSGIGLPVRSLSISYRSAARFGETLDITTSVAQLKRASVTFGYEIRDSIDQRLIAEAEVELACAQLAKEGMRVCALPQTLLQVLQAP